MKIDGLYRTTARTGKAVDRTPTGFVQWLSATRKSVKQPLSLRETIGRASAYEFVLVLVFGVIYLGFSVGHILNP
jgi:hypothetical protein